VLKTFLVLSVLFLVLGCATSSEQRDDSVKSKLNYLNGENYSLGYPAQVVSRASTANPGDSPLVAGGNETYDGSVGVPLNLFQGKRPRVTTVSGTVFLKQTDLPFPVSHKSLVLRASDGKVLQRTRTRADGRFTFEDYIPNGQYRVEVEDNQLSGGQNIEVQKYEHLNLKIQVQEK
jgi:hypothetical protein